MKYLPVFLNIRGRNCLVVGGGEVAARKVGLLLDAGAIVTVISPELSHSLTKLAEEDKVKHINTPFDQSIDISAYQLVIAATDDADINQLISDMANESNTPVNVVDHADEGSFIMPSIVDRDPVQIAISTGGSSPVLARLLRGRIESLIPSAYGRLASLVDEFREKVKQRFNNVYERRTFWEKIFQSRISEMIFSGKEEAARQALQEALDSEETNPATGEVYLVGAGPGDPDLLTFRALRLMQQADVVLHDRLVSQPILDLVRRDAERFYVGKERDFHSVRQEKINQMLVDQAKEGKRVLRLKGGDPFIFGRGGEEIETLAENGIPFQVVPGITAASGCASYSGIPLTHRDYSQSCTFVTGNLKDGTINLNWQSLAVPNQTIVFYMGLKALDQICEQLIHHGLPEDTPAAIVQQGTTRHQRVLEATLESLPTMTKQENILPPTLIIVGQVVKLHRKLQWFEPAVEPNAHWDQ
ncbi:MAG: uroporphyrinogen-III C-methyltransferase [Gammaproteobacteria bacterium]|nr:MAG: uroporphyrinogen-III C-methyltransferase [Gammaproteobacteria bacterium]